MDGIESRHGLGSESAPWGNEVTESLNSGLERTRLLRDSVDRSLSMGAKSFTQAGNRRQELEQAWSTHPLSINAVTTLEEVDTYFPFPPIQAPGWANWAVIPSFTILGGNNGFARFLSSNGSVSFSAVWGEAVITSAGSTASIHGAGNLIPIHGGLLDLGWFRSFGTSGTTVVSMEIVVNWIR